MAASPYSSTFNSYASDSSPYWSGNILPNSYSSWSSQSSFVPPSPSSSPGHKRDLHHPHTTGMYSNPSKTYHASGPASHYDTYPQTAPSSASSDSSLSPHMVFTPMHDGHNELPRLEPHISGHAAVRGFNVHDMPSTSYAHSPDWCMDPIDPNTYGIAPTRTMAWHPEDHTALGDKPRTQRTQKPHQGYEMTDAPASSQSVLFSQHKEHQHQQQQRPQLHPLQIPGDTRVNPSSFLAATASSYHQHQFALTPASSSTLSSIVTPPAASPSYEVKVQPIKLHHPRPSRRIPIISLDKLASASADLFVTSPSAHPTSEISPLPPQKQSIYRTYDFPDQHRRDEWRSRQGPSHLITPPSWSPIDDYYYGRQPTQRDGLLLCSCGCMESYSIQD